MSPEVTDAVPILIYHSVTDRPHPFIRDFAVTPHVFGAHLDAIQASGRTPLTVSEFASCRVNGTVPPRPVLITIDDGWKDTATTILPILHARQLPATLYVTTGFLRGRQGLTHMAAPRTAALHWNDLPDLRAAGIEIGAHSVSHAELDTVSRRRAWEEIVQSRDQLEDHLQASVSSFAYPHGYSDRKTQSLVAAAGFTSACMVKHALSHRHASPMSLARILVRTDTPLDTLRGWLAGRGLPIAPDSEQLRTLAWRQYRRGKSLLRSSTPYDA